MTDAKTKEVALIVDWIERNPEDRRVILGLAMADHGIASDMLLFLPEGNEWADREAEYIKGFLAQAVLGHCSKCFQPIVTYPDLRAFSWPGFEFHDCHEALARVERVKPEPKSTPKRKARGLAV